MYLFAFRSRTQAMKMYDLLRTNGIMCEIINTPREISASCGLSVKVENEQAEPALNMYNHYHPDTLIGIFYRNGSGYVRYR